MSEMLAEHETECAKPDPEEAHFNAMEAEFYNDGDVVDGHDGVDESESDPRTCRPLYCFYWRWTSAYVSESIQAAAKRGIAWAVRHLELRSALADDEPKAGAVTSFPLATELTDADRSFLTWLADAATRLCCSNMKCTGVSS